MAVSAQEFVLAAIEEGYAEAPAIFMEHMESMLASDVALNEAGSVENQLQMMIDIVEQA